MGCGACISSKKTSLLALQRYWQAVPAHCITGRPVSPIVWPLGAYVTADNAADEFSGGESEEPRASGAKHGAAPFFAIIRALTRCATPSTQPEGQAYSLAARRCYRAVPGCANMSAESWRLGKPQGHTPTTPDIPGAPGGCGFIFREVQWISLFTGGCPRAVRRCYFSRCHCARLRHVTRLPFLHFPNIPAARACLAIGTWRTWAHGPWVGRAS